MHIHIYTWYNAEHVFCLSLFCIWLQFDLFCHVRVSFMVSPSGWDKLHHHNQQSQIMCFYELML